MRTALYRHFDGDELLYVGISLNHVARLSQHNYASHWSDRINNVKIEHFPTREEAFDAETAAIQSEHPAFNIMKVKADHQKARIELETEALTYRTVAVKPVYKLSELKEFGIGGTVASRLIEHGKLGHIKIPLARSKKGYVVRVTGWQIMTYFELAEQDGWLYE
tara:strand:+ start:63 stop:554 length:492 start_codon:yes stop_codon:yes gene_type:complete